MVNCIECKLIAFDLLNSSWKPICINPQNVAIINPMKHVPSIHYGIPMPFKYMQNMQSMQVFMQQKKRLFFLHSQFKLRTNDTVWKISIDTNIQSWY